MPLHHHVPHLSPASLLGAGNPGRWLHRQPDQGERRRETLGPRGPGPHAGNPVSGRGSPSPRIDKGLAVSRAFVFMEPSFPLPDPPNSVWNLVVTGIAASSGFLRFCLSIPCSLLL